MMKTLTGLCLITFLVLGSAFSLQAATPSGERGGALSATEEAQQHFLRRLRHEIAVQRVLSRQLVKEDAGKISAAPPIVQHKLLSNLSRDGVSPATLAALRNYPAVRRQEYAKPKASKGKKSCSTVVDETWKKLDNLFEKRYGEKLNAPVAAETTAPKGT